MSAPLLEARNLSFDFAEAGRRHAVLSGLDLSVSAGEVVAIIGASGSGKSTLLNLLAAIDHPSQGDIRIQGKSLPSLGEPAITTFRRRHIGYIYQLFNLIPTLTVAENIALPLVLNQHTRADRRSAVAEWLARVGLADRDTAFPDQLSGGEQQRVAVARALIHQPTLVLADEPTGNLDAETGRHVLALLLDLARASEQTLVMVTHSREVAASADRVLRMADGRLQAVAQDARGGAW